MNALTYRQLHALSLAFYEAHAKGFDASRDGLPWPGWKRVLEALPVRPSSVLDIGCGNGRFAAFLAASPSEADAAFDYVGTDANESLLEAARQRVDPLLTGSAEWLEQDFLASAPPGEDLPRGPFDLVVLMGVLHHVPGRENREALLRAAADRLAPGGFLVFTAWQFADRPRFDRRRVEWSAVGPVLGEWIDESSLEAGDALLRFGDDPSAPPRYCHQMSEEEFRAWPAVLGLEAVADFHADGADEDLNRYWILKRGA